MANSETAVPVPNISRFNNTEESDSESDSMKESDWGFDDLCDDIDDEEEKTFNCEAKPAISSTDYSKAATYTDIFQE